MGCLPRQRASGEDVPVVVAGDLFAGASYAGLEGFLRLLADREGQRCGAPESRQPESPLGRRLRIPACDTDLGRLLLQGTLVAIAFTV